GRGHRGGPSRRRRRAPALAAALPAGHPPLQALRLRDRSLAALRRRPCVTGGDRPPPSATLRDRYATCGNLRAQTAWRRARGAPGATPTPVAPSAPGRLSLWTRWGLWCRAEPTRPCRARGAARAAGRGTCRGTPPPPGRPLAAPGGTPVGVTTTGRPTKGSSNARSPRSVPTCPGAT